MTHSTTTAHNAPGHRFSAAAATYDRHGIVQQRAADHLIEMMQVVPDARTILDVGCGTGKLTERLLEQYPDAAIDALDAAAKMVDLCRSKWPDHPRLRCHTADILTFGDRGAYDLIASSSCLHWIHPFDRGIRHLAAILAPGGHLIFCVMTRNTFVELQEARRLAVPHKPPTNPLPEVHHVTTAVEASGFHILRHETHTYRTTYPSTRAFFRSIHELGVTGSQRHQLTRQELHLLEQTYEAHFTSPGEGIYASHEVDFYVTQQPA